MNDSRIAPVFQLLAEDIHALGVRTEIDPRLLVAPTIMASREDRIVLARTCLELLEQVQPASSRLSSSN